MACATLANARDSARASLGASAGRRRQRSAPRTPDALRPRQRQRDAHHHHRPRPHPPTPHAVMAARKLHTGTRLRDRPRRKPERATPRATLLDGDEPRAGRAAHAQQVAALLRGAQRGHRLFGRSRRPAIDLDDDVAGLQARALGRAARTTSVTTAPLVPRSIPSELGDVGRQRLQRRGRSCPAPAPRRLPLHPRRAARPARPASAPACRRARSAASPWRRCSAPDT